MTGLGRAQGRGLLSSREALGLVLGTSKNKKKECNVKNRMMKVVGEKNQGFFFMILGLGQPSKESES